MKKFNNKIKNTSYTAWRFISPLFDPIKFMVGIKGYFWFINDLVTYKRMDLKSELKLSNIFPQLHDKTNFTGLDAHYFYQQLWAFENIMRKNPQRHIDIGSTFQMSGYISKITKSEFVDIRPIKTSLSNFKAVKGDITKLPYKDGELKSISCLHVVEHVGLGRYGDSVDPNGSEKAINELQRVLSKDGNLYFSTPVGVSRLCFNAHRIFDPEYVLKMFSKLELIEFSMVDDRGVFIVNSDITLAKGQTYACGMYHFKKRKG